MEVRYLGQARESNLFIIQDLETQKEKRIYNESTLSVLALTLTLEGELVGVSN